jgi:hypothetical protein
MAIVAAIKNLLYFFQNGDQANVDYHEEFMAMMEMIEEYGGAGSLTQFPNLLKQELKAIGLDLSTATAEESKEGKKTVREKFLDARIPKDFIQLHKYVPLVADVMFVNGLPFLVTSSRGISLVTIEHLPSPTARRLVHTLE